jgi:hypothetical protein
MYQNEYLFLDEKKSRCVFYMNQLFKYKLTTHDTIIKMVLIPRLLVRAMKNNVKYFIILNAYY